MPEEPKENWPFRSPEERVKMSEKLEGLRQERRRLNDEAAERVRATYASLYDTPKPTVETRGAATKGKSSGCGVIAISIGFLLVSLYALVRFVKWAWTN
jgi:hypothetical protein